MVEKNYWSHKTPSGEPFWIFADRAGYNWDVLGENLAADFKTSEGVISGWFESASHQRNMLNPKYQEMGIGVYRNIVVAEYGKPKTDILSIDKITQFVSKITLKIWRY